MSHTIIISNKRLATPDASGIQAEITYTPDHDMTPAQMGDEVAKIVRKLNKLCDSSESGE